MHFYILTLHFGPLIFIIIDSILSYIIMPKVNISVTLMSTWPIK